MIESKKTKQQLDADKVRSFIAIETNQKVKKTSDELIEKLKRMGFRASWTKTSNTHLTLFFLVIRILLN
jgi:2'-5' RNA ligase